MIDSASGAVSLSPTATLDYESTQSYTLIVEALVVVPGGMLTTQTSITVSVDNVLEQITIRDADTADNAVREDVPTGESDTKYLCLK